MRKVRVSAELRFWSAGDTLEDGFVPVVAPAVLYEVVCWGSSISTAGRKRFSRLVKKASSAPSTQRCWEKGGCGLSYQHHLVLIALSVCSETEDFHLKFSLNLNCLLRLTMKCSTIVQRERAHS